MVVGVGNRKRGIGTAKPLYVGCVRREYGTIANMNSIADYVLFKTQNGLCPAGLTKLSHPPTPHSPSVRR